jgi:Fur family iron response transcriptional regulator
MATIYNTLHQFRDAGLLRAVVLDGTKLWFDTNTSDHHHFYCEQDGELKDIPAGSLSLGALPPPPPGMEIAGVEATVRLRPRRRG